MREILYLFVVFIISGCSRTPPKAPPPPLLYVEEIKPNPKTVRTRQNLLQLLQVYDLSPFIFTNKVRIESMVVPHSHPVLTINTRYADGPYKLLSVFLHEQLHWWAEANQENFKNGAWEIAKIFPGPTEAGGPGPTHTHILICFLEYRALIHFLGKKDADKVINDFIRTDKLYPWIYTQVLTRYADIDKIVKQYNLAPPLED